MEFIMDFNLITCLRKMTNITMPSFIVDFIHFRIALKALHCFSDSYLTVIIHSVC